MPEALRRVGVASAVRVLALCILGQHASAGICTVSIVEPVGEVNALEPIDVRYTRNGCDDGSPYIVTVAECC